MPQSLMINRLLIDGDADDLTVNSANQFDWLVMACDDHGHCRDDLRNTRILTHEYMALRRVIWVEIIDKLTNDVEVV